MRLLAFAFSLAIAMLALGPAHAGKSDNSLTVAIATKFPTMDNFKSGLRVNVNLGYQIWDPIVERDPKTGKITPHLAESWELLDEKTWEFKLRPGVKFHNGNPLNAESVRFTLEERILPEEQKSPQRSFYSWIDRVEVVDDLTFRVHTSVPYPLVLERFNLLFIYDPEYTKAHDDDYLADNPMGSGPFSFVEWKKGSHLKLKRNPNYWKEGVPSFETLTYKIIPETSTRLAELISGGIDVAQNLVPDQLDALKPHSQVTYKDIPILRIHAWQFDSAGRAAESPLQDARVRKAIWHAIDREAIIKNVLRGLGDPIHASVNPHQFGHNKSITGYPYDPEKAKALLKEAGYADGFEVELWYADDIEHLANQAALGYLDKVGVKLKMRDYRGNVGQAWTLFSNGKTPGIYNFSWGSNNVFDADAIIAAFFLGEQTQYNYTNDEKLSQWLEEARSSMDKGIREDLYHKAQQRIFDEAYWMPFFIQHQIHGHHADLDYAVGLDEVPRFQYGKWK